MELLSERLTHIRDHLIEPIVRNKLAICIDQAEAMEEKAELYKERSDDPPTSWFDGTQASLNTIRKGVLSCYRYANEPIDELQMVSIYLILEEQSDWMKFVDPVKQDGTLRKRRTELEQVGLLRRFDMEGTSRSGQSALRHVLTQAGREL